jgi:predicted HNH restriction endonuclease
MDFVSTKEEIRDNLEQFEKYLRGTNGEREFAYSRISGGKNFMAYKIDGEFRFVPSRYIGYANNTKDKHYKNRSKHGTQTTEKINKIINHNRPLPNKKLESEYLLFTSKLGIKPHKRDRKYWNFDLQVDGFLNNSISNEESDFEKEIAKSIKDNPILRKNRLNQVSKIPEKIKITTSGFKRNPDVVAEVLLRANGVCEQCNKNAPFIKKKDSTPYLEVHHKIMLSSGGEDTVKNAIAICPNCHRELHFGV